MNADNVAEGSARQLFSHIPDGPGPTAPTMHQITWYENLLRSMVTLPWDGAMLGHGAV